jgi:hypothetical protein
LAGLGLYFRVYEFRERDWGISFLERPGAPRAAQESGTSIGTESSAADHHVAVYQFRFADLLRSDYRSMVPVPAVVSIIGDALVALGLFINFLVFENSFGGSRS